MVRRRNTPCLTSETIHCRIHAVTLSDQVIKSQLFCPIWFSWQTKSMDALLPSCFCQALSCSVPSPPSHTQATAVTGRPFWSDQYTESCPAPASINFLESKTPATLSSKPCEVNRRLVRHSLRAEANTMQWNWIPYR